MSAQVSAEITISRCLSRGMHPAVTRIRRTVRGLRDRFHHLESCAFPAVAMTTRSMDPPESPARPPRGGRIHLSKSVQPRLANGTSTHTHSRPHLRSKSDTHGPMNCGPNVSLAPIEGSH